MLRKAVSLLNSPCVALVVAAGFCLSVVPWSLAGIQPGAPDQPSDKQPEIQQDDQPAVQPARKPKALTVPVLGDSNIPASGGIKPSPAIARLISAA